jgi:hypothetical protein
MWRVSLRLLAMVTAAALCGCQVTVVENLPEGAGTDCPAGWRGAWIGLDELGRDDPDFGVHVAADCTLVVAAADPNDPPPDAPLHPRFVGSGDGGMLLIGRDEVARLLEWKPDDPDAPPSGWVPLRWRRDGDSLEIESPDHRRIATLIVNGGLDGAVHWSSPDSGYNLVKGDAVSARQQLHDNDFFDGDDPTFLRRVGDDRRALDRALQRAKREEDRRAKAAPR